VLLFLGCSTALSLGRFFEAKPDLHRDLEVADLLVVDVAPDVADLEPVEIAQCLGRPLDRPRIASSMLSLEKPTISDIE
jgi:hypothetical protein